MFSPEPDTAARIRSYRTPGDPGTPRSPKQAISRLGQLAPVRLLPWDPAKPLFRQTLLRVMKQVVLKLQCRASARVTPGQ